MFTQYWEFKVDTVNETLHADADIEPTQWITTNGLQLAHTQVPAEQLWKGYLTPKTISEYMDYFTKVTDK